MRYSISAGSATPPYEQLRVQVRDAVAAGSLAAGAKLPTVRALAEELGPRAAAEHLAGQGNLGRKTRGHLPVDGELDAAKHIADEAANRLVDAAHNLVDTLLHKTLDDVVNRRARATTGHSGCEPEGERSSGGSTNTTFGHRCLLIRWAVAAFATLRVLLLES